VYLRQEITNEQYEEKAASGLEESQDKWVAVHPRVSRVCLVWSFAAPYLFVSLQEVPEDRKGLIAHVHHHNEDWQEEKRPAQKRVAPPRPARPAPAMSQSELEAALSRRSMKPTSLLPQNIPSAPPKSAVCAYDAS